MKYRIFAAVVFVAFTLSCVPFATAQGSWEEPFRVLKGSGQRMEVDNDSGFFCNIFAANNEVATLAPGERVEDFRRRQVSSGQVPAWAQCYQDASLRHYVGFAHYDFNLSMNQPTENCWAIINSSLRGIDGKPIDLNNALMAVPAVAMRKMKVPGGGETGATYLNIYNNSGYALVIHIQGESPKVNGADSGLLLPGRMYLGWLVGDSYSTPMCIEAIPLDFATGQRAQAQAWRTMISPTMQMSNTISDASFILESQMFAQ